MHQSRFSVIFSLVVAATACKGATVCTEPEPANLWVSGSEQINLNPEGEPLPTLVRVYQVSAIGELEQATFDELLGSPEAILGDTLLSTEEITVYPGRSAFRSFERDPGANYVVGVAVVRQPAGNSWRVVLEMPKCGESSARPMVRFSVDGYTIQGTIGREKKPQGCDDADADCLRERSGGS